MNLPPSLAGEVRMDNGTKLLTKRHAKQQVIGNRTGRPAGSIVGVANDVTPSIRVPAWPGGRIEDVKRERGRQGALRESGFELM